MAERFAVIIQDQEVFDFERLRACLSAIGVELYRPGSDMVTLLDDLGNGVPCTLDGLSELIVRGGPAAFKAWFGEYDDLTCWVRGGGALTGFSFRGQYRRRYVLFCAIFEYFRANFVRSDKSLLVFDPRGVATNFDWEEFYSGMISLSRDDLPDGIPATVLMSGSLADRVSDLPVMRWGGMALVASPEWE